MKGKIVLITGSTDGIGKQTAINLAKMGATILVHGRNEYRCLSTIKEIEEKTKNRESKYYVSDFSSLNDVRNLVLKLKKDLKKIDVLINNAGIYSNQLQYTEDGYEMTFAVNHLSHFLLTNLLLDLLKVSPNGRIITISSIAHSRGNIDFNNLNAEQNFDPYNAYALSKLANILFTYELSERLKDTNITVNCLHPGVISTKLLRAGFNISGSSLEDGAETVVYLASSPNLKNVTGQYFIHKKQEASSTQSYNLKIRKKLWEISEKMVGLKSDEND
jgi:NAD(P)-dependent dehydrogenase (short-subunit alcohol dehydrogenase family)